MSVAQIIIVTALIGFALWLVSAYNRLIALRGHQTQLRRRRFDLIPTVGVARRRNMSAASPSGDRCPRQTLACSREAARLPGDLGAMNALSGATGVLADALGRMMAVVEAYPELKADAGMTQLSEELATTENRIAFARQAYNDSVTITTSPSASSRSPVAGLAGTRRCNRECLCSGGPVRVQLEVCRPRGHASAAAHRHFAAALLGVVTAVNGAAILSVKSPARAGPIHALLAALPLFYLHQHAVTLLLVLGGAWLEAARLRGGGAALARELGARPVSAEPAHLPERQLRHIATEMAIAARQPIPQLFVLDAEESINACAAGHDARDAAVMISRGALERLTRDELQGVYAHEYAHVLNGDIELNMRLAACVSGVLIVHQYGRWLTGLDHVGLDDPRARAMAFHPLRWLAGGTVMAVGAIGWVAARLLQAGVSREREHLADAAAVRLTRLAEGLGGALRKLRWQEQELHRGTPGFPGPRRFAHLWFSSTGGWHRWLSTHPPLTERIRRVLGRAAAARARAGRARGGAGDCAGARARSRAARVHRRRALATTRS
jgi:Zn-dependent protease with chaperone function